jgi:hypothetical protein
LRAMRLGSQQIIEDRDCDPLRGKISPENSSDFAETDDRDVRNCLPTMHAWLPARVDR